MAGVNIKIDPDELEEAAGVIISNKEQVEQAVSAIKTKIDDISTRMEGQASTAFMERFQEIYPVLSRDFPETMEGISEQLKTIARVMREADTQLQNALRG